MDGDAAACTERQARALSSCPRNPMASTYSFDIVSEVDLQEADNAINQAIKEAELGYDLR